MWEQILVEHMCFLGRSLWFTCTCAVPRTSICLPLWPSAPCRCSTSWWRPSSCSPVFCTPRSRLLSGDWQPSSWSPPQCVCHSCTWITDASCFYFFFLFTFNLKNVLLFYLFSVCRNWVNFLAVQRLKLIRIPSSKLQQTTMATLSLSWVHPHVTPNQCTQKHTF